MLAQRDEPPPKTLDPQLTATSQETIRPLLFGIFLILAIGAVVLAKMILLPIALAFMLTLTLSPVVRFLSRYRIPTFVSAGLIVLTVVGALGAGVFYLSGPVKGWIDGAPEAGRRIEEKLSALRRPVDAAVSASKEVEKITRTEDPSVQRVQVQQPGLLSLAAGNIAAILGTLGVMFVLLFFLLGSGRLFYEKLVRVMPTMTEKKRAVRIVQTVEDEVSRYLLTIAIINAGLGVAIAVAMWSVGLPNPVLWGVMAAGLNFVPYVGAIAGVAVVSLVSLVSLESPASTLLVGGLYFGLTTIEGQFITPALVGRRLEMNTVAVFLAVAIWGWLWGVPGVLMAVPFLVSLRVFCDHFEGLSSLGEFLASRPPADAGDDVDATVGEARTP